MNNLNLLTQDPGQGGGNGTSITNPFLKGSALEKMTGINFFVELIPKTIGWLFVLGGISFFFMLVWGAIGWILSGGDKASLESAKNKITNAVIGIVLLICSIAIVKLIQSFFNIHILSIDIGPLVIQ